MAIKAVSSIPATRPCTLSAAGGSRACGGYAYLDVHRDKVPDLDAELEQFRRFCAIVFHERHAPRPL